MTRHNPIISAGTRARTNKIPTALELERDTIQCEDLDIPAMEAYIKRSADPDSSYPAGLYAALTDGSPYHASFVPGPDFNALSKSCCQNGFSPRVSSWTTLL